MRVLQYSVASMWGVKESGGFMMELKVENRVLEFASPDLIRLSKYMDLAVDRASL